MNVMRLLLKKYRKKINKVIRGGNILSILFALMISLFTSPFNIYADDYTGSTIQGFNVSLIDVEQTLVNSSGTSGYMSKYIYEVEFILDDSYVGYINVSGQINYYPYNSSTLTTYSLPGRNYFVNGTSFKLTFQLTGDGYTADNRPSLNNTVFTYGNHDLYKHSEIDSLETIIDLLTDLYNNTDTVEGLLNSQLTQLQLIAQRCNIANEYLETLIKLRQFNISFESFPFVYFMIAQGYNIVSSYDVNYTKYPLFDILSGSRLYSFYAGNTSNQYDFIIIANRNINSNTNLNNYFSIDDGSLVFDERLERFMIGDLSYSLIKFHASGFSSTGQKIITLNNNMYICPIFAHLSTYDHISTEFALQFGLSNSFLDNIEIIAQGTQQSNQSSSDLENQTSSFDTTSSDLYTSENAFNTDMNSKLQSIDTSFNPSTSFGSKFLSSANWVRTQFDNITSTTPFGTVLSFSMLLGLSLLIIGKVFK